MGAKKKEAAVDEQKESNLVFGFKVVVIVVLLSLAVNRLIRKYELMRDDVEDDSLVQYNEFDQEPFVPLVQLTYDDKDLVEWTPAAAMPSDPDAPGDLGVPVIVPPEKEEEAEARFKENEFNVVVSEMMSLNRTLKDNRFPECTALEYPNKLPQTSVVIVFHNEAWTTLLRTLWSVYTQSPRALLREIILVDDFSDRDYLIQDLHDYIKNMPLRIVIVRTLKRTGLIQARLLGAKYVRAPVITFLDAHCECNAGWMEPLLARVAENRQAAVAPVIDVITDDTFEVKTASTEVYGAFNWGLTFKWLSIPDRETDRITNDRTAILRSPAMAGGLFAIDKEFFLKSGSYDEGMKIWGGENIEMSIRLWTCGGSVEMAQCSRVGHVFRKKTPYTLPGGATHVVFHNNARFVDVWLDKYSRFYYSINPGALEKRTNVTERLKLRKELRCKSFQWYLENIYPESVYLVEHYHLGHLQNAGTLRCIDSGAKEDKSPVKTEPCHDGGGNQLLMMTEKNEIRWDQMCLDATKIDAPVSFWPCHGELGNQVFDFREDDNTVRHRDGQNCLTDDPELGLTLKRCDDSVYQKWRLTSVEKGEN